MSFDHYKNYTQARIGLGNAGAGLPTKAWLDFSYHQACAVDAVNISWDMAKESQKIATLGYETFIIKTKISSREEYLKRPDLGGMLHDESKTALKKLKTSDNEIIILATNGLSSAAVENHLENFLKILLAAIKQENLKVSILLAQNGRVALIDDIGEIVKPKIGLVIVGERPGLSAPDSLGVYLTYEPKKGCSNALRNCVSNIRPPHGLGYEQAANKVMFLMKEALKRKISGILLKDESIPIKSLPI